MPVEGASVDSRGRAGADASAEQIAVAVLVARSLGGAPEARETLARRALGLALSTAIAVLASRDEAGDVAQDVAVTVLRDLRRLREPLRFDAWVHRITTRRALSVLRRRRLSARAERPLEEVDEPSAPDQSERSIARLSLAPELTRALGELPGRQRLAVVLRYVHDLSEEEVARALGSRPGTAAALLSRARSRLRADPALRELFEDRP